MESQALCLNERIGPLENQREFALAFGGPSSKVGFRKSWSMVSSIGKGSDLDSMEYVAPAVEYRVAELKVLENFSVINILSAFQEGGYEKEKLADACG
ncbi:hypothetical protein P170DRAFT_478071 [Aspergillus steynii IBT 23096]|uniref:Uncharacterized protein n=1 Tax=Aspergillus steynii IBT 23096 TaxID=1392250 RepID=A0A2I2G2W3_9EURO|nr:uncharacterized protein P170DRAFT_478071 [Aspergillus steynii IBT 23096]PLB47210.1 hypothetical protein P170DRAFT_478071 [Aspergillus steynii IBT 23096]